MKREAFVGLGCCAAEVAAHDGVAAAAALPETIAGVRLPKTAAALAVTELARAAYPAPLFGHALRSFVLARALGAPGEPVDEEIMYVAALAHDLGMTEKYRSPNRRFEIDGADVARTILLEHGRDANAARIAWDAVALHATGGIAQYKEVEVRALANGIGADVLGGFDAKEQRVADEVFRAVPRDGYRRAFIDATVDVARRKPRAAVGFVADVAQRMIPGFPKPGNFMDAFERSGLPG